MVKYLGLIYPPEFDGGRPALPLVVAALIAARDLNQAVQRLLPLLCSHRDIAVIRCIASTALPAAQ